MGSPDTMIFWLARVCRQLREQAGRTQVEIAANLARAIGKVDQSTIYRFEQGKAWPRRPDVLIAAYADELDIPDPRDIWDLATSLFREHGDRPTLESLSGGLLQPTAEADPDVNPVEHARQELGRLLADATQAPAGAERRPARASRATGRRRAAGQG